MLIPIKISFPLAPSFVQVGNESNYFSVINIQDNFLAIFIITAIFVGFVL